MVVRYYRSRCSAAVFSAFYILLSFQCMVSSFSTKARLREESSVSRKPIYVIANSENTSEQPQLYTRHRRKLPAESNDQLNTLDDDVPLQEYQGVFGRPGIDFPVLSSIPVTKFNCRHVKNSNTGYYADTETNCQVFHVCDAGRKISFLCPNGTIFRQSHLICDWWFRVDCERSPELYDQSVQQLQADQNVHNNKQPVETIANAMQNAVNIRNSKEIQMILPSPTSTTNKIKENFNSESDLPNRNSGSSQRNTLRPNYQSNSEQANRNNFNPITSPPRMSSFNVINPTFPTTELPSISTRFQSSENTRPNSVATDSYTFVTSTYKPDVTPLIHNFLPPNDPGEGFREQQVLAETASFAGSGKFPFQNYYYMLNFVKHPSKENTNKASEYTTSNQGIETTQYQTESYTDIDESFRTTFYPNNDFRDLNIVNANNITESDNSSYALYYTSTNEAVNSFGTTLPNELRGISPSLSNDASKPQVSEFILNSQSNSELNGETPTEQNLPLLTNMTQEGFNQLFPKDEKVAEQSNTTSIFRNSDLATEHSSGIVQSGAQKPQKQEILSNTLQFKSSPDLRELAQVFSRALSAYLENPEQFRKILSEVRPTEPPSTNENANGEASSIDDEVLAFSEDVGKKSTPFPVKSPVTKNTNNIIADQVTFTTSAPTRSTIKDPETFAEEINNFMFSDPHNFIGHSESNEFNVNETYYPSSGLPSNATTLPATRAQFTVSPLIDFTQNVSRFSPPPVTFTEAATVSSTFNGIPKNDNLYNDFRPQSNPEIGQSLSEKEHFITADTQSFVSRDNLLRLQNTNLKPGQNFKSTGTTQNNFKSAPVNQLPSISQTKYDADYQTIKSSKNMQFGMRTTSVTRAPFISSRADFSSQTTPSNTLTTKTFATSKATTYHPEVRTTRFSTHRTPNDNYQPVTNAVLDRDPKSYNTDMYKDLSPDSGHFNETAKALINMMEEAKSNNVLRHQLVLLLVNDKGLPTENKSVKEMKSKLLKALLKPAPDKNTPRNYRNDNERISRSDYNSSVVNVSPSKARKERVVVHKHKVSSPSQSQTTDSISKSTVSSFQNRNERSTSKPVVVAALTGPNDPAELSESDSRAVDLLKSLYTIASNNWTH